VPVPPSKPRYHSEEALSESEAVIRKIIAQRQIHSLAEFKPGIQQYQALQRAKKSEIERTKRTVKKRALAQLNRSKLTINPNIDMDFFQDTAAAANCSGFKAKSRS